MVCASLQDELIFLQRKKTMLKRVMYFKERKKSMTQHHKKRT